MKIEIGSMLGNSTLCVSDKLHGKYMCRCTRCGVYDVYKSENSVCRICSPEKINERVRYKSPTDEMKRCINIIEKSYNETYRNNSYVIAVLQEFKGIKQGDIYGDLKVEYLLSKVHKTQFDISYIAPEKAILKCRYCNYYRTIEDIDNIVNIVSEKGRNCDELNFKCTCCERELSVAKNNVKQFIKEKSNIKDKKQIKKDDKRYNSSQRSIDEVAATIESPKNELIFNAKSLINSVKPGSKLEKLLDKVKTLNENLNIQDVEPSGSSYKIACTCNKCGTEIVIPSVKKNKAVDCPGCERLKTDKNYISSYMRDYVGTTRNLLRLTERNGDTCTVICDTCRREHKNIRFYDWYKGKVICDCKDNTLEGAVYCSECRKPIDIPLRNALNKRDLTQEIKCSCGGRTGVTYQEIVDEYIEAPSIKATASYKLGVARKKIKSSTEIVNDSIIKAKDAIYVGTDGNMYYKCTCMEHGTDMILNDEEIAMFNHDFCCDARQHIMKDITKDTISY